MVRGVVLTGRAPSLTRGPANASAPYNLLPSCITEISMKQDSSTPVGKLDAARRQLTEAIFLWSTDRDRLAVHTLTMAAFGVLNHLAEKDIGYKHANFIKNFLSEYGYKKFYRLSNYLKHADRDADLIIDEPIDGENEWRIGLSITIYRGLSESIIQDMGAFHMMSMLSYPDHFQVAPDLDPDIEAGARCGASMLREDVALRRVMFQTLLASMQKGLLDANADLLRKDHSNP